MNKKQNILYGFLIAILFFFFGFLMQPYLNPQPQTNAVPVDMSLFWDTWKVLEDKYPFDEPTSQEKVFAAITGLVGAYKDEHMAFFPPVKSQSFAEDIAGEFAGAGMEVNFQSGYLVVIAPLKDSAAERAGIMPGDVSISIDGQDLTGIDFETGISMIRGRIGTELTMTVARNGVEGYIPISLIRELIHIPILDTEIIDDVFIIHFYTFSESSEEYFLEALTTFKQSGARHLLLDLRNNPGGFLTSAVTIASHLLDQGLVVVQEYDGVEDGQEMGVHRYRSLGYSTLKGIEYDMSILINRGSASASEILAGALRDHGKAKIYGQQSFGKGSVQELIDLPKKTSLKVTISKWLTPNGIEISGTGIEPDVVFAEHELEETIAFINNEI